MCNRTAIGHLISISGLHIIFFAALIGGLTFRLCKMSHTLTTRLPGRKVTPGYRNRFNHPRPEIVARYTAAGTHNYRTDYDGALTFTFAEGASRVPRRERANNMRYWRNVPTEAELAPLE